MLNMVERLNTEANEFVFSPVVQNRNHHWLVLARNGRNLAVLWQDKPGSIRHMTFVRGD